MDSKDDRRALLQAALEAVETMQAKLAAAEHARTEPIAIVGLGCRLPGAEDPTALWRLLHDGVDAVREVPRDRWDPETMDTAALDERGRTAARLGGFLERVDLFDPAFFAISPREALTLDPQQRLLLEVTWEALEDAAQAPDRLHGSSTGVFVGITTGDYAKLVGVGEGDQTDVYAATGNALNAAAGRLAFVLGLHGPCMAVDTACSSSLTAIHLACQSLRAGECDLALAGGVNVVLSPNAALLFARWGMLAADGRCKTFDAAADGFVRSEGCGVIVLKRLTAALAAGDRVRAVILGSAVNQDGASSGLTVPNGPAQEAVIRRALAAARIQPHEVDYVEAHGTGTPLGDPIEVEALAAVMAPGRPADRPLAIGSIKTNIGHPEAASGVAGLLKVVLALEHEAIPPHVHFRERSPRIPWPGDAIYVPSRLTPWPRGERRRIAGVSSFGFSGTNAHVIVAEPPVPAAPASAAVADRPWHLVTVSGRTEAALKAGAERLAAHLASVPDVSLPDLGYTRNAGRSHLAHRAAVIAKDGAETRERLLAVASGAEAAGVRRGSVQAGQRPRVAWLFTGQGSQYAGMGRELYRTQPVFRRALERCDATLRARLERPLLEVVFGNPESAALLDDTAYTQPALFALEWALAELWRAWGVVPAAVMGHSVGEIAAAATAGVLTPEDGAILAAERGRLMQACRRGAMTAVFAGEERIQGLLASFRGALSLAAVNGPESTVVSGEPDAMVAFRAACDADGIRSKPLTVSHAFHSPMMEPMLDALEECARGFAHADPQVELISNLTGDAAKPGDVGPAYWRRHAREAVRFDASMRALRDLGCDLFLEIGPQPTLLGMGRRCVEGGVWLPSLRPGQPEWSTLLESLAELYTHGAPIDWAAFDAEWPRRKLPLPSYPFQRARHWVEAVRRRTRRDARDDEAHHPLLGRRIESPALRGVVFETEVSVTEPDFLKDHRVLGSVVFPATAYLEQALSAGKALYPNDCIAVDDVTLEQPLILKNGGYRLHVVLAAEENNRRSLEIYSRPTEVCGDEGWTRHASGVVSAGAQGVEKIPEFELLPEQFEEEVQVEDYYAALRDIGLDYGPTFRCIRRMWRRKGEALGELTIDDTAADSSVYSIHPGLLDSCFQLLGVALKERIVSDSARTVYVPVGLRRLVYYRSLGTRPRVHVSFLDHVASPPGTLSAEVRVFDDQGQLAALVEHLALKAIPRQGLQAASLRRDHLYEVRWVLRPISEASVSIGASGISHWLILGDQGGLGDALGARLRQEGFVCQFLPAASLHEATDVAEILPMLRGETALGIVYCGALDAANPESAEPDSIVREAHLSGLLWGLRALAEYRTAPTKLWIVTRGAQSVRDKDRLALLQSCVWGVGRVAALEYPEISPILVDLDPEETDGCAVLSRELGAHDGENQVAYRGGKRSVARLGRMPTDGANTDCQVPITRDATYVITGGMGTLGLEVAKWLAGRGACHLLLVGRRAPMSDALTAIESMRQAGVNVVVAQADVSSRTEVLRVLRDTVAYLPPVRGVIHAAGIIEDAVLAQLDCARVARVFAPKVVGAWNLHETTRDQPLDFFVLFSSAAAVLGSRGQASYAAANAFLDTLAHHRKGLGLPALSVNWGAWQVGMTATLGEQERLRWKTQGIGFVDIDTGIYLLEELLARGVAGGAVLSIDWRTLRQSITTGTAMPLLTDLLAPFQEEGSREVTGDTLTPNQVRSLASLPEERRHDQLRRHIEAQVMAVMGVHPGDLGPDVRLPDLGLDSLMAMDLKNRLQASLGISLPATLAFEFSTVPALVKYLGPLVVGAASLTSEGQPALTSSDDAGSDGELDAERAKTLLGRIDGLSDEEVQRLLKSVTIDGGSAQ